MSGRRAARRGQRGVTLLEVTITLAIVSMLGLVVLLAFRLAGRAWESGEKRAEAEQRIRILYGTLAERLASIHPVTAQVDGKPVLAFQGMGDRIFFYSAPDGQGPLPQSAMVSGQAYFVEPGKGLVVQESYPLVEGRVSIDPRGSLKVLDPKVTRLRFRYLAPPSPGETDPRWVETWDANDAARVSQVPMGVQGQRPGQRGGAARPASPAEAGLPLAVELTVGVGEERGERELGILVPIRVGRTL